MNSNTSTSAPPKTHGKFKLNKKSSATTIATDSKKNFTASTAAQKIVPSAVHNVSTASNGSDCMIIDDDQFGFSTAKSLVSKELEEDDMFLEDFNADDLTFTKITAKSKTDTSMADLYAKYGSPKPKSAASALDTFDIDKQLNSNASYVSAMKKLDENMKQLRASPLKNPPAAATSTGSKFKFNVKGQLPKATATVGPPVVAKSSGFSTKTMDMAKQITKTSATPANNTFKPSTITSNTHSNSASSNLSSSTSFASSFDTPVTKPYTAITPVESPVESSAKTGNNSL